MKLEFTRNWNMTIDLCVVCGFNSGISLDPGEFCPCCGIEFYVDDYLLNDILKERKRWIDSGYKWNEESYKPEQWDPITQMQNIPNEYM